MNRQIFKKTKHTKNRILLKELDKNEDDKEIEEKEFRGKFIKKKRT
jgi:hypothetical protein